MRFVPALLATAGGAAFLFLSSLPAHAQWVKNGVDYDLDFVQTGNATFTQSFLRPELSVMSEYTTTFAPNGRSGETYGTGNQIWKWTGGSTYVSGVSYSRTRRVTVSLTTTGPGYGSAESAANTLYTSTTLYPSSEWTREQTLADQGVIGATINTNYLYKTSGYLRAQSTAGQSSTGAGSAHAYAYCWLFFDNLQ